MAGVSEKEFLFRRSELRTAEQEQTQGRIVQCCCLEIGKLGRVPFVKIKRKDPSEGTFSSSIGVFFTMLGAVVGTGNIWRFPRIVANHATEGGALAFLLVWFLFLWVWSIPITLIEYGVGRYTKKSTIESYYKLIGPSYRFMGAFQAFVGILLGSYYSVLVGWCGYYFIHSCTDQLPGNLSIANGTWNDLQDSSWPVFSHSLAILAAGLSVSRGVSTIEPVNKVIVPILLITATISFYQAIFLPFASNGIVYMFTPRWSTLGSSKLWLDAITQNAWDTGAGIGTFITFATFMKKTHGAVKLGSLTPFFNNIVSLMCGITVFATVFSVQTGDGYKQDAIVNTLRYNGEDNTGLTFIWMPLLYGKIGGGGGRFLAIIYYISLTFAGLSSLIGLMELPIHVFTDFGFQRLPVTITVSIGMFLLGTASATNIKVLVNQDSVWAYAAILSGCLLTFMVLRYGVLSFREKLYNKYGLGDWPLPLIWVFLIMVVVPIEGVGLIVWWGVDQIRLDKHWWQITNHSLATILTEWAVVMLICIGLNWWLAPLIINEPKSPRKSKLLGFFVKYKETHGSILTPIHTPKVLESGSICSNEMTFTLSEKDATAWSTAKEDNINDVEV